MDIMKANMAALFEKVMKAMPKMRTSDFLSPHYDATINRLMSKEMSGYVPGEPGAKLGKKAAKGTVGLRHGAPFGQR